MNKQNQQSDLFVNENLKRDLKALYSPPKAVAKDLDQTILNQFQDQVKTPQRIPWKRRMVSIAAAIILTTGIFSLVWHKQPEPDLATTPPPHVADLDQNGSINILDAFWLARQIRDKKQLNPRWDLNTDGIIDQSDVDLVAQMAVQLNLVEVL